MTNWIDTALQLGFDAAAAFDPAILQALPQVRDMCAADKCRAYGRNWTCPPTCGTLEECAVKMHSYRQGILLQTVGHMSKTIDSRCYRETERCHLEMFRTLSGMIRTEYPTALCLGSGGCRVCKICAYPDACRFPQEAYSSMEGYGLFVTQVCRDCGVNYHHGEGTITYTACILY